MLYFPFYFLGKLHPTLSSNNALLASAKTRYGCGKSEATFKENYNLRIR